MNERVLLLEMPVVSENEVFAQSPVASVSTESTLNLEGDKLRTFVMGIISKTPLPQYYELTDRELGTIISHHCTGKPLRKAAIQTIPQVLISNNIISPWKRKEGKSVLSGLVAAPIVINGEKYLCCVTLHKNLQKKVTPYAITLKDADGNIVNEEKAVSAIKVPDSTNGNSSFGNTRLSTGTASLDANSPSAANIPNKVNESKTRKSIKTWYRGYNSEYGIYGQESPHLLWLTTDYEYAKEFGNSVIEYKIDMSKCRGGNVDDLGYLCDFDISEGPSKAEADYLTEAYGINSYCYYGGVSESSYCMCLWSEEPIIDKKILTNMKQSTIKLNESQLRRMIAESVKKVLNERDTHQKLIAIEKFDSAFDELVNEINNGMQYLDTRDETEEILNSIGTDIHNLRMLFQMPERDGSSAFGTDGMRAF